MDELAAWIDGEKLTKSAAARRFGVSPSHLQNILSRHRKPSPRLAFEIEAKTKGKVQAKTLLLR
jgi:DNA-binding transcriptional regulator YdaS (Cro superfamily)